MPPSPEAETGLSQVFIAFNLSSLGEPDVVMPIVERIIEHLQAPSRKGERARYPGERTLETRRRNLEEGVPVEPSIWQLVQSLC